MSRPTDTDSSWDSIHNVYIFVLDISVVERHHSLSLLQSVFAPDHSGFEGRTPLPRDIISHSPTQVKAADPFSESNPSSIPSTSTVERQFNSPVASVSGGAI